MTDSVQRVYPPDVTQITVQTMNGSQHRPVKFTAGSISTADHLASVCKADRGLSVDE